jgi:galactose mutarotase-like enzyme
MMENDTLRAEFIAHGGCIVSLRHKPSGFDFLYQQTGQTYVASEYGKLLKPEQSAGYDDMVPTIVECHYEDDPWKGTVLPDHGEAWAIDWDVTREDEGLRLSCHGVRFPYRLTRRVSLAGPNTLRMDYSLENLSAYELFYLWSAHPMFFAPAGARFSFPEECHRAVTVASNSGRLGSYGDEFAWPLHIDAKGRCHDVSLIRETGVHDQEKCFFRIV